MDDKAGGDFKQRLMVRAWLARSRFCVLVGVGHELGFFFFFFFLIWVLFRWDFGGQWAMVAWWASWRRGGGDWVVEALC